MRGRLGWAAVWLVVAAVVVLPHLNAFTALSKIDEYQHVDYLDKTMHLEHVEGGELVGQTAMREQACRGIDLETFRMPPCRSTTFDAGDFPGGGYNHTYADPPVYYAVTGVWAAVVGVLPGIDSLVTAGRSAGVVWLAAGLVVVASDEHAHRALGEVGGEGVLVVTPSALRETLLPWTRDRRSLAARSQAAVHAMRFDAWPEIAARFERELELAVAQNSMTRAPA